MVSFHLSVREAGTLEQKKIIINNTMATLLITAPYSSWVVSTFHNLSCYYIGDGQVKW